MGAWGHKTFENDSACDFMSHIESPIKKLIKKKHLNTYEYDDVRAAAEIIIRLSGHDYNFDDEEIIDPLIEKLEFILSNKDWINTWEKSSSIKRYINLQIKALKVLSSKYKKIFVEHGIYK